MKATVVFPITENKVLLARKMKKVGAGKWNGFGGKPEGNETIRETACRELFEESGRGLVCKPEDLMAHAVVDFFFFDNHTGEPNWSVVFYTARIFEGTASGTSEMQSPTWFAYDAIPYDDMLPADKDFIPKIIRREIFKGRIRFNANMTGVSESDYEPIAQNLLEI